MPQAGDVVTLIDLDGRPTGHFRVQHASHRKLALRVITATAFGEAAAEKMKQEQGHYLKIANSPAIR